MQPVLYSGYLYKSSSVHRGTLSRKTRGGDGERGGRLDRTGTFLSNQMRLNASSFCVQTSRSSGVQWTSLYYSTSRTAQLTPACRSALKKLCVWASVGPTPPTRTTASSTGRHFGPILLPRFMMGLMKLPFPRLFLPGSATPLSCT